MIRASNILYLLFFLFIACNKEEIKPSIPQEDWKERLAFMIEAREAPVIFTIDDEVYQELGHGNILPQYRNRFMNFDSSGGWNYNDQTPPFPGESRSGAVTFTIDHKVYMGLGYSDFTSDDPRIRYHTDFWVYDNQEKTWSQLPFNFPDVPRRQAIAFSINGKEYVGSGLSGDREVLGDFYEFDPQTGWKTIAPIDVKRYGSTVFMANGTAYICLGKTENNSYINHITKFIPGSKTWKGLPTTMNSNEGPHCMNAITFVIRQNDIDDPYIVGGTKTTDPSVNEPLADCWGFDPRTETWVQAAPSPYPFENGIGFTKEGSGFITSTEGNFAVT